MRSLLLVADTREQLTQLHKVLAESYTLFTAMTQAEALDYLRLTRVDVLVAAMGSEPDSLERFFLQAKTLQPFCVTLYLAPPRLTDSPRDDQDVPQSDFFLRRPIRRRELRQVLLQALAKQQLLEEVNALRKPEPTPYPPQTLLHGSGNDTAMTRIGQILRHFAKAFSTNFDLNRTLELFLDAIGEFLGPSRLSVLVFNPTSRTFDMRAHRGFWPQVAQHLRLRLDEGLALWLATEARILHRAEVDRYLHASPYMDLARDLQALRSVASIPLIAAGSLVGIVNLGERITGQPYSDDELNILFSLASHIAVGIQDIYLYHQVQSQKLYIESIVARMSSGLITLDTEEKIRTFNQRAEEILGRSAADMLHTDLRNLPSPLGDMLYTTLRDGHAYRKHEVTLTAGKIPLEVSTYQIFDDQQHVSGSVMVFEDLRAQKQLYAERQRADQLDFLNKIVARMAHEIKNPLVSIQTFIDLLTEHYDDPEFRHDFRNIVRHDVRTINTITEKLLNFTGDLAYNFVATDINEILRDCFAALALQNSHPTRPDAEGIGSGYGQRPPGIDIVYGLNLPAVRLDPVHFHKALTYLVLYLLQGMPDPGHLQVQSQLSRWRDGEECVTIALTGKGCVLNGEEFQHMFDPFGVAQSTLVDVGPCVSQKIIEEHGGRLEVLQESNRDTTFIITLPTLP